MVLDLGQDCVERHLRPPRAHQCVHALGQTVGADRSTVARDSLVEHKPTDLDPRSNRLEGTQGPEGMPDQIDRVRTPSITGGPEPPASKAITVPEEVVRSTGTGAGHN